MCTENPNFFATDNFYARVSHILTSIEVPVHLFGAYIILTKTPEIMKSVKTSMLVLHLVGAFCDVFLSFFLIPVLTMPICAGYVRGFLSVFEIPTIFHVYVGMSIIGVVGVTIILFFEDRRHRLITGNCSRGWKRMIYLIGHYVLSASFHAPAFLNIPDQDVGKLMIKQKIPCIQSSDLNHSGFFVLTATDIMPCYCVGFLIVLFMSQMTFFLISIARYLIHAVAISETTKRLQKQFFFAMCLQVFIPILVIVFPVTYLIVAIFFDYYNQGATNMAMATVSFHGLLSTVTMLIVDTPYRKATLDICRSKCFKNNRIQPNQSVKREYVASF